jgi:hypothetical protein
MISSADRAPVNAADEAAAHEKNCRRPVMKDLRAMNDHSCLRKGLRRE